MERSRKGTLRAGPREASHSRAGLPDRPNFFTERNYFPNFDVAVAELLARFGSTVAALTVAVMVHEHGDVSPPLAHRWAQEKICVPFSPKRLPTPFLRPDRHGAHRRGVVEFRERQ